MRNRKIYIIRIILSVFIILITLIGLYYVMNKPRIGPVGDGSTNYGRIIGFTILLVVTNVLNIIDSGDRLYKINTEDEENREWM
ncbi:hypothetical protein J2TS4_56450 [Paenibacillus sp. J2TS4]|nr:hypothetical protein J2TS4_56450 [Paenibacillus sp. J2TS4]